MARLVLCVLALAASGLADPAHKVLPQKQADNALLQKQLDLSTLFYHVHEPLHVPELVAIADSWDVEKNIDHYSNITAVKVFGELYEYGLLYRNMPFHVLDRYHGFEAQTLYNVLWSAKDYDTFYKTAVWFRQHVNEYLFVYVYSTAILHRPDTQGVVIPPIYEIFPEFFTNSEVLTTAQRVNVHGLRMVEHYPTTYVWENNVVVKENMTIWPYYYNDEVKVNYFTWDQGLNAFYYNWHLAYPKWLGGDVTPLVKDRRGEWFWYIHKQLLTRYYMERLSNGLGEIPELSWSAPIKTGIWSGLQYYKGIFFPTRPNNFVLNQDYFVNEIIRIQDFERRVREAIDLGYVINNVGEHINIHTPEAIDILGRVIECNVDSPNSKFYGDFITLWKGLLGNSLEHTEYNQLYHGHIPEILPSVLEHYQTALRDPAFYLIWKRVLNIFKMWQESLPMYKLEELAYPTVSIKNVEVDKLVTYFENTYMNITNQLHMTEHEAKRFEDDVSVLVQRPRLNHKVFQVRVKVNSEAAKTVVVRFFLAPKYDSLGNEIPLKENWENFFQLDQFTYDLVQGENVIKRDSTQNLWTVDDWTTAHEFYAKSESALHGKGSVIVDQSQRFDGYPQRLLLPKGRVGGMPFVFVVYISEYRAPKVPFGQGFDPAMSLGFGSGARFLTDDPLGFPLNKPVYDWQIQHLKNFWVQDVTIYHKHTPEIYLPHLE
ncbi:unnamed protein product [Plutella xylostella]|uniref:(diamondback moth) hypothetical protein n=1 Tax=Plutella xylostella TaxID=51655 RepID=A0A8S4E7T2_PLUXY|nr:unnamed protein product [Plutella xylostella]